MTKAKSHYQPMNSCPHVGKCSGYPYKCGSCKYNPNKDYYEPEPFRPRPYTPYPWVPWLQPIGVWR